MKWLPLPKDGFIAGRIANKEDLSEGNAVYLLKGRWFCKSKPLNIDIPQYAYHIDKETGDKTKGFIIQAEQLGEMKVLGFQSLESEEKLAALYEEFVLLGTEMPKEDS